jgi:hypothetical protein
VCNLFARCTYIHTLIDFGKIIERTREKFLWSRFLLLPNVERKNEMIFKAVQSKLLREMRHLRNKTACPLIPDHGTNPVLLPKKILTKILFHSRATRFHCQERDQISVYEHMQICTYIGTNIKHQIKNSFILLPKYTYVSVRKYTTLSILHYSSAML